MKKIILFLLFHFHAFSMNHSRYQETASSSNIQQISDADFRIQISDEDLLKSNERSPLLLEKWEMSKKRR